MKISTVIRASVALAVLSSLLTVSLVILMHRSIRRERECVQRQLECLQLGHQLSDASDFLTREARRFTVFGDQRHYDAYWTEVNETKTRDRVVNRLKELNGYENELALIETAKRNSDSLIATEKAAMLAVNSGDLRLAQTLMFDENYDRIKQSIMEPIGQFEASMNARSKLEAGQSRLRANRYLSAVTIALVLNVVLVIAGLYLVIFRRTIVPLLKITDTIAKIAGGMIHKDISINRGPQEIQQLAKAANGLKSSLQKNVQLGKELQQHRDLLQQRVEERTAELKQSELRMRMTFESSPYGMAVIDSQGGIMSIVNPCMASTFGCQSSQMNGQTLATHIAEDSIASYEEYLAKFQSDRESNQLIPAIELSGRRQDGTEFPMELRLNSLDGATGDRAMVTIVDISERIQHTRSIEYKNKQLWRLNTELMEFAYSTSHDLKSPLTSIVGLLSFCESDLQTGDFDEVRANVQKAKMLTGRLADRIEATLSLAKSEMNSSPIEAVSVQDRVEEIWDALQHDGIRLEASYQHSKPIQSVSARLDTVLENLLSNAIKFQDSTEKDKIVRVSTWTTREDFHISIEDNGIGIPNGYQDKIFRLFHRLGNSQAPGTGLGLPLVRKNVMRLGGQVDVESEARSTAFHVTLPRTLDPSFFEETVL